MSKKSTWVSQKIRKIMHEGIRDKKVSQKQAIAVAFSMSRKRKTKGRKRG